MTKMIPSIVKKMMTKQIVVIITVRLLGTSERFFQVAKRKNRLTNIIMRKKERNI